MKAAIVGYGKMGKEIEEILSERKHQVISRIDPTDKNATHGSITAESLKDVDVVFEFSKPEAAVKNIELIASHKKNIVIGTTGWANDLKKVEKIVAKNKIALVYGNNFSIGVNMFYRIVERAAELVNKLPEYDIYGYEVHHNQKADSPSGTAKSLAEIIVSNITRKKKAVFDRVEGKISGSDMHFASVRGGGVPGTHVVAMDGTADSIELRHTARSRAGFALGAVMAGEWLKGKKGMFTVSDYMNQLLR